MNIKNTLKSKVVIVSGVAVVALAAAGGVAYAVLNDDDLSGDTFDRAAQAALSHIGDGTVTDAERGDDDDVAAYEVEVTRGDGTDVDVLLDENFAVLGGDARPVERVGDDRVLTEDENRRASEAALAEVPGSVLDIDASDDRVADRTAAYEIEVAAADGVEWNIWLDSEFAVLTKVRDN